MKLYEKAAVLAGEWGRPLVGKSGFSSLGIVAGATYPEEMKRLRGLLPASLFLVPGYGAQGAPAEGVRSAFAADGRGAIVNSSRGIIFAYAREPYKSQYGEKSFERAIEAAVKAMKKDINDILGGANSG